MQPVRICRTVHRVLLWVVFSTDVFVIFPRIVFCFVLDSSRCGLALLRAVWKPLLVSLYKHSEYYTPNWIKHFRKKKCTCITFHFIPHMTQWNQSKRNLPRGQSYHSLHCFCLRQCLCLFFVLTCINLHEETELSLSNNKNAKRLKEIRFLWD